MREAEKRPRPDPLPHAGEGALTSDALLNGRLHLRQPLRGHRVGSDAILLAAASPVAAGDHVVDIGAGVGAVGLALMQRCESAQALLVDIDPALAALASANVAANNLAARARVAALDFLSAQERRNAGLIAGAADLVVTNPPFFEPGGVRASPDAARARAHVLARTKDGVAPLHGWIVTALALLAPGGCFVMIHRPDALGAILAACAGRLGALALLPIHPRADQPAHRLIIGGIKGARGPLRLLPPLALHEASGAFTPLAEAIHRGDALIDLGLPRRRGASRPRVDRAASPD
jgi:tRNA1(Val) A37 N6-methylase TrmN6